MLKEKRRSNLARSVFLCPRPVFLSGVFVLLPVLFLVFALCTSPYIVFCLCPYLVLLIHILSRILHVVGPEFSFS